MKRTRTRVYRFRCSCEENGASGEYVYRELASVDAEAKARRQFIEDCELATAFHIPLPTEVETELIGVGL